MSDLNGQYVTIAYRGQPCTLAELAEKTGLPIWTLYHRWRKGARDDVLVRPRTPQGGYGRRQSKRPAVSVTAALMGWGAKL